MDRGQAVSVLKQIFERCEWVEGKSIKLMPPKENDALSSTFQICIQMNADNVVPSCISEVAKENGLMVKEKDGFLIVYKPYPHISIT